MTAHIPLVLVVVEEPEVQIQTFLVPGGRGGSGICVVRYKIAEVTPGIKATGGNVSKVWW